MGDEPKKTAKEIGDEINARLSQPGDPFVTAAIGNTIARSEPKRDGITDTSKISSPGASDLIACQLMTGRAIELMEERGQRELVGQSQRLPTKGTKGEEEMWAKMGVTIVRVDDEDPLFSIVMLPEGWSLRPTEHAMWSDLVDQNGGIRAGVFYKAAFYDRGAHVNLNRRFNIEMYADDCIRGKSEANPGCAAEHRSKVVDGKTSEIVHWTDWHGEGEPQGRDGWRPSGADPAHEDAKAWLKKNHPDWNDPVAYW